MDSDSLQNAPLYLAVVEGDPSMIPDEVQALLDTGVSAQDILGEYLIPAMDEVGRLYDEGEYFVPELMLASKAMQDAMAILSPLLAASGERNTGYVVIGTVAGDMHDIGKNLVASMLAGAGFDVTDLGVDVSPEKFLETAREISAKTDLPVLVMLSALLTTTMPQMKVVVDTVAAAGLKSRVKVLIGGAPVTQAYADQIGADGYSDSAFSAVTLARSF